MQCFMKKDDKSPIDVENVATFAMTSARNCTILRCRMRYVHPLSIQDMTTFANAIPLTLVYIKY